MISKEEILLKQKNAEGFALTHYIAKDGYVWKMIENAMEEYHQSKVKENELLNSVIITLKSIDDTLIEIHKNTKPIDMLGCPG